MNINTDQFKYTKFWNELVTYVQINVTCCSHWLQMKNVKNCFTGVDIVDKIYEFLKKKENTFPQPISRSNAVKIASILMTQAIFYPHNSSIFADDSKKLYSFTDSANALDETDVNLHSKNSLFLHRDMILVKLLTMVDIPILESLLTWENEQRLKISFNESLDEDNEKQIIDSPNLCLMDKWSECALKVLNNVCIYDNFTTQDDEFGQSANKTSSELPADKLQHKNNRMTNERQLTDSEIILKIQLFHTISEYYGVASTTSTKSTIINHLRPNAGGLSNRPSFFPPQFVDVFSAILKHLINHDFKGAISIIKLSLNLLPDRSLVELHSLLNFIQAVASYDHKIQLEDDVSNLQLCLEKFTPCIFYHKLFSQQQAQTIVSFIINNMHLLFAPSANNINNNPRDLPTTQSLLLPLEPKRPDRHLLNKTNGHANGDGENVYANCIGTHSTALQTSQSQNYDKTSNDLSDHFNANMKIGNSVPDNASQPSDPTNDELVFCDRVTKPSAEITKHELYRLLCKTINDPEIGDKMKKKFLKNYQNHYPQIYEKYQLQHANGEHVI